MYQHAKLVFHEGLWHFRIDGLEGGAQAWSDKETALTELAERGWKIDGPYPKRLDAALRIRLGILGYSLVRSVQ